MSLRHFTPRRPAPSQPALSLANYCCHLHFNVCHREPGQRHQPLERRPSQPFLEAGGCPTSECGRRSSCRHALLQSGLKGTRKTPQRKPRCCKSHGGRFQELTHKRCTLSINCASLVPGASPDGVSAFSTQNSFHAAKLHDLQDTRASLLLFL